MKTSIRWAGGVAFVCDSEGGHKIVTDGPEADGGRNLGARPMEVVLMGMGACTSYDVVSILKKGRQAIEDCRADVTASRAETDPKVFTEIHVHFTITGRDMDAGKVERAVQLSAEKYCSASIMLGKTAKITHSFEVLESGA